MQSKTARGSRGHSWRIRPAWKASSAYVAAVPNDQLRSLASAGDDEQWESIGEVPCFTLGGDELGRPLEAGWYELSGRLEVVDGGLSLPSVRLHYVPQSPLADFEVVLPEPDGSGRIGTLLLFLDGVESLQFFPGVGRFRFRMGRFSLCRVSRARALCTMLGASAGVFPKASIHRLFAWTGALRRRGLKRATDELYARYRERVRPHRITEYQAWIDKYDTLDIAELAAFERRAAALNNEHAPLISLLLCGADISAERLRHCLDSVLAQIWTRWELCIDVDASLPSALAGVLAGFAARDRRVKLLRHQHDRRGSEPCEDALSLAGGDFIAPIDADGALRPHSLLRIAEVVAAEPELAILYTDEDRIDAGGVRCDPDFKPDWNPDLLRSHDYIGHLAAIRAALVREVGGFHAGSGKLAGFDLVLRCTERLPAHRIRHLPEILYYRLSSPGKAAAIGAGSAAMPSVPRIVAEHLERIGSGAKAEADLPNEPGACRIRWPLPLPTPKISVIIPTRDRADMLQRCIESILARSTYPDFELVVVDNQSSDHRAIAYLQELVKRERVRVLRHDDAFNFSAINNRAARQCTGQLLALVNNDIEVITPGWLEEMAGFAVREDVGAVGAMLYFPDNTIQHAGMLLGINGIAGHVYAGKPRGHRGYQGRALVAQNLSAVTGACLLVRRELFEAVGGLDERLPVEFNDVDFCLRLHQRGYLNVWTPFAEMYHHESASRVIEDADAKRMREAGIAFMLSRWGDALRADPAYNPNLSLQSLECGLAFPPRTARPADPQRG